MHAGVRWRRFLLGAGNPAGYRPGWWICWHAPAAPVPRAGRCLDCSMWLAKLWRSMCGCAGTDSPARWLRCFSMCHTDTATMRLPRVLSSNAASCPDCTCCLPAVRPVRSARSVHSVACGMAYTPAARPVQVCPPVRCAICCLCPECAPLLPACPRSLLCLCWQRCPAPPVQIPAVRCCRAVLLSVHRGFR